MSRFNYTTYENAYVLNDIHIVVNGEQIKLSDFVRTKIHDNDLSYRKVADKSGGLITHSTVSDVISEKLTNLSVQAIMGLAKGLGVTEQLVFDIARRRSPDIKKIADERFVEIATGYADLTEQGRRNLEPLLVAIESTIGQHKNKPGKTAVKKSEAKGEQGEESFRATTLTAPKVLPESEYENLGLKKVNLKKKKTLNTK